MEVLITFPAENIQILLQELEKAVTCINNFYAYVLCTKLAFWPQSGCGQSELHVQAELHVHRLERMMNFFYA